MHYGEEEQLDKILRISSPYRKEYREMFPRSARIDEQVVEEGRWSNMPGSSRYFTGGENEEGA